MGYRAEAPLPRDQILLIPVTLGDRIPVDHPVRLFDEILSSLDWSKWENHSCQVAGQPAIPPRVVAGAILYGLSHGLRSSWRLEWACKNAVDFMWLVEGRPIDHSTFCHFRTRSERELKGVFRQIGRLAMKMRLIRLNHVALDETRIRANSSRRSTRKRPSATRMNGTRTPTLPANSRRNGPSSFANGTKTSSPALPPPPPPRLRPPPGRNPEASTHCRTGASLVAAPARRNCTPFSNHHWVGNSSVIRSEAGVPSALPSVPVRIRSTQLCGRR